MREYTYRIDIICDTADCEATESFMSKSSESRCIQQLKESDWDSTVKRDLCPECARWKHGN